MITVILIGAVLGAAQQHTDSVAMTGKLDEVVVSSAVGSAKSIAKGKTASIDEHIVALRNADAIKRGSYAWEPTVNNMQSERLSTTIDGMKIFPACTDRMDPVTSYVETANLQRINLSMGLDGNPQATGNIGGALDLRIKKFGFGLLPNQLNLSAAYEGNASQRVLGADAAVSNARCYANLGVFCRKADNYHAANDVEIEFSQFEKINTFLNVGFQPRENNIFEATVIFDRATNVGYPALTMDVGEAVGLITSVSFRREAMDGVFSRWETKAYYNKITHEMDDTNRPDVVIHMDMPGRSHTAGLYSLLQGNYGAHSFSVNYDIYRNVQYADMTMYPLDQTPMFMLTWPDVATTNTGLALADNISLGERHSLRVSAKGSFQHRNIRSDEGLSALKIYFPDIERARVEASGRIAAAYQVRSFLVYEVGVGVGARNPSTTESFGYFINNTMDNYDYLGNPRLANEKALELSASVGKSTEHFDISANVDAFFFSDYIIGDVDERLSHMTLGANGVKVYRNLRSARVVNASVQSAVRLHGFSLRLDGRYAVGKESTGNHLPFIAPLSLRANISYIYKGLEIAWGGDIVDEHRDYSEKYGERPVAAYNVWKAHATYATSLKHISLSATVGVENIFDADYTTYADWNGLRQKGRNVFLNVLFSL